MIRTEYRDFETDDPDGLDFLLSHDPPRSFVYRYLLGEDLKSWQIRAFYGPPIGIAILLGMLFGWAVMGGILLVVGMHYVFLLTRTAKMTRDCKLVRGRVNVYKDHVLTQGHAFKDWRSADAVLEDGTTVHVVINDPATRELLDQGSEVEVMVMRHGSNSPGRRYGTIAYRAVP